MVSTHIINEQWTLIYTIYSVMYQLCYLPSLDYIVDTDSKRALNSLRKSRSDPHRGNLADRTIQQHLILI